MPIENNGGLLSMEALNSTRGRIAEEFDGFLALYKAFLAQRPWPVSHEAAVHKESDGNQKRLPSDFYHFCISMEQFLQAQPIAQLAIDGFIGQSTEEGNKDDENPAFLQCMEWVLAVGQAVLDARSFAYISNLLPFSLKYVKDRRSTAEHLGYTPFSKDEAPQDNEEEIELNPGSLTHSGDAVTSPNLQEPNAPTEEAKDTEVDDV